MESRDQTTDLTAHERKLLGVLADLVRASEAVLDGGFEREDTERTDALFECLGQAVDEAKQVMP